MSDHPLARFTHESKFAPEAALLEQIVAGAALPDDLRARISARATDLVRQIRDESKPSLIESFLAEYGLSSREGVALMCLAEAMLRVPDASTMDALIEDKIAPSDWGQHLGTASSSLVNASTWALMLTGRVLDGGKPGIAGTLRAAIRRLGEPVIRASVARAMKEMGRQFVLAETIDKALIRANDLQTRGYTYSYDMLGEAAMTAGDAARYATAYADAIAAIAKSCGKGSVEANPGISIKLSALHPRYEVAQETRVLSELVPVVRDLARRARVAGMGLNIDAEEQDRLTLSLRVIDAVLSDPELAGWDGFGVVVQAYGKRAGAMIDWLHDLATRLDRRIMVRLVKGAYWDSEIKHAQAEGLADYTLFTSKPATDVSYIAHAKRLLDASGRIYPQFATHNAHTVAAILEMAHGRPFEFQRLHGMGERLHDIVMRQSGARCRIYAPVGAHRDLLAYLVRRLLENGANSSFVHQIVDKSIPPEVIAADPFAALPATSRLVAPADLFGPERQNSHGFDLTDAETLGRIEAACDVILPDAIPLTVSPPSGERVAIHNPATGTEIGHVTQADAQTVARAISDAMPWQAPVADRAAILRCAADLYEANFGLIFAALTREAGKTLPDAVGELREAVDFLRYYAMQSHAHQGQPCGIFTAISPWNFPLAIFTGQIAAALATGNAVLAKPAEQTPAVATIAVRLLHQAGVPRDALQLLHGPGDRVGTALTSDARISGVVFTGSTRTALMIRRRMAAHLAPSAPLIAETGGINAMIVDSTALPEQAVRDILASAFRSSGQRCSALRCLYVQEDIALHLIRMIKGAMDELQVGDPALLSTDIGPVIDARARDSITDHIRRAQAEGRVLHQSSAPDHGHFIAPTLIRVSGIEALKQEVFGPVLHVATWRAADLDRVISAINGSGYGLTFGLHSRIDSRVQKISDRIRAGNIYVNRNQIGAVVGSQPFGGEGLSGTGPKAGGPLYLRRFMRPAPARLAGVWEQPADLEKLRHGIAESRRDQAITTRIMPGPTGESNILTTLPRNPILCLGPGTTAQSEQMALVHSHGGMAVGADGRIAPEDLSQLDGIGAVVWWGKDGTTEEGGNLARALAARNGPIIPLITGHPDPAHVTHERHLCIDTTAAGGNAALLAGETLAGEAGGDTG